MGGEQRKSVFSPAQFLAAEAQSHDPSEGADLLILNQPISDFDTLSKLWQHSEYRVCADGGANRLFDLFAGENTSLRGDYLPNLIHGDLDSLRGDVRDYYAARGVQVTQDHDQYSTDFNKTMQKISSRIEKNTQRNVLILGTLSGRVDQGLGLLHEFLREGNASPHIRLWLFSEASVSFVLRTQQNVIRELQAGGLFTENVGLVPVYGPAIITTTGLEWDVKQWPTHMGGQVSTSNHVRANEVSVETNGPILFTIERSR